MAWDEKKSRLVDVPEGNFTHCLGCGAELIPALGSCGCVGDDHSDACKNYCGCD
jgi:hypothetical protein